MFLHLFDDEKFVDAAIANFENVAPGEHKYWVFVHGSSRELKYVKDKNKTEVVHSADFEAQWKLFNQTRPSAILVHYLTYRKARLIDKVKAKFPSTQVVWFFWGGDGFDTYKFDRLLFQPKTARIRTVEQAFSRNWLRDLLDYYFNKLRIPFKDVRPDNHIKLKVIKDKIDFIVPVVPGDYDLFLKYYPSKGRRLEWNYLSIEQMMGANSDHVVNGSNILLGNSATKPNNHIEAIDILSKIDLSGRKVHVPLSYGEQRYKQIVMAYGKKKLGASFSPLTDFLPLDRYNEILQSCGIVIMNHNRQQALGNIVASLWMGAKVFLNENSTVHGYLSGLGVKFFSIEHDMNTAGLFDPLERSVVEANRTALVKDWSHANILCKTKNLLADVSAQL